MGKTQAAKGVADYQVLNPPNGEKDLIIVSKNPLINKQLASNNKFSLLRSNNEISVFVEQERLTYYQHFGLPKNVIKFIKGFSGN